ncbi:hypothetical protein IQ06DRAFT_32643 [Phaeosphaeriaceae sp. SRC1lsM3a]|nr:hypothetical protein IQ06DRAFT_32643 [Stagonospora sp. SRC1lsM3a]
MDSPNKVEAAKATSRPGYIKAKIWQRLFHGRDHGAVEPHGLRHFGKRVKSLVNSEHSRALDMRRGLSENLGHSAPKRQGYQKIPSKSRWLRLFKRIWKRRDDQATNDQYHSAVSFSLGPQRSARDQLLGRKQQSPRVLGTVVLRRQRPTQIRSPRDTSFEAMYVTSDAMNASGYGAPHFASRTLPSRPPLRKGQPTLHKAQSVPNYAVLSGRDSHDCQVLVPTSKPIKVDLSARLNKADIDAPLRFNNRNGIKPSASSFDRAEYERLMKVCFKSPARRKPIPGSWRRTALRRHVSRGSASAYCKAATISSASSKKTNYLSTHGSATEPRMSWPMRPACRVVNKTCKRTTVGVYPTLPFYLQYPRSPHLRPSRTLPHDWRLRDSQTSASISTTSDTIVADMQTLDLDANNESSVECSTYEESETDGEEDNSRDHLIMSYGDDEIMLLLGTDDSDGIETDEDIWYDVFEETGFGETLDRF